MLQQKLLNKCCYNVTINYLIYFLIFSVRKVFLSKKLLKNSVIYKMTDLKNVAQLPAIYASMLIIISTILTMLGGHIPAKMASKKDAVEALRSE